MQDNLAPHVLRFYIQMKRESVRDALTMRHSIATHHANARLENLYDWTTRMAAKIKADNGKKLDKPKFIGFFNCEIPANKKDDCKAFIRSEEEVALLIEQYIASGYKLSVAVNEQNGAIQATMTCNDPKSKNAGYAMSAYAPHWYNAIAVLMWKHHVLLGGVWERMDEGDTSDFG